LIVGSGGCRGPSGLFTFLRRAAFFEAPPDRARTMLELELNEPGSPLQSLRDHPAVVKLLA